MRPRDSTTAAEPNARVLLTRTDRENQAPARADVAGPAPDRRGLQQPRALRSSDPTQPERLSRARNQRASAGQKEIDGASPPG